MARVDIAALTKANEARWRAMKIDADRIPALDKIVRRVWLNSDHRAHYDAISRRTSVPAIFIAAAHLRESDAAWDRSLAQGDRLTHRSMNVPAGRIPPPAQPPFTFDDAAFDALVTVDHVNAWTDWSIGGLLTKLELWNGAGYYFRGFPSPYVWSWTDQYRSGKFVSDGHFVPGAVDPQIGVAAFIARAMALDQTLSIPGAILNMAAIAADHPMVAANPTRSAPLAAQTTRWLQVSINEIAQDDRWRGSIAEAVADVGAHLPIAVDNDYGRATKAAVRGFQRAHGGLIDDGIAGPLTRRAIATTLQHLGEPQ
jgi:lysozyme family protein